MPYPERIRALREDHDLTQKQVAVLLGIAQNTYSQYETGKLAIPIEQLLFLCQYYHVSSDYILGLTKK